MAIEQKDIASIREDYARGSLSENEVDIDPVKQFSIWFNQALDAQVIEPNAMVLSTLHENGFPTSRVVLLKDIKADGFSFFTNYQSQKSLDAARHNKVSLLFFWAELQRQVRIDGVIDRLPAEDSDEYYASRPRGSRIGAWASPQSQIIDSRDFLEQRVEKFTQQFAADDNIPRPDFWGGYIVRPVYMEFWQGRSSRLHDRLLYSRQHEDNWAISRLAP